LTNTPWPAVQPNPYTPPGPARAHASGFDPTDLQRAALLLVDLQNDFCHPRGAWGSVAPDPTIADVLARIQQLLPLVRRAGLPILHLRTVHNEWTVSDLVRQVWSTAGVGPVCWEGSWGWEFFELQPDPADRIVAKFRPSGFLETDLEITLRAKQVGTLLLAGLATPGGLFETAYDAVGRDHPVVLLDDCIAGATPEEREALAAAFTRYWGQRTTSAILAGAWS
jgi:ureidoacrylate peracid hydrolase